jgi:hypothetical protein
MNGFEYFKNRHNATKHIGLHFVSFPIINMGRRDIDIAFSDIKDKEIA